MMKIPPALRVAFWQEAIQNGLQELTYDIETSHNLLRSFPTQGKTYLSHKQIKVPSKVISIQYKWAHEKKTKYLVWERISNKYGDVRDFDDSKMIEHFVTNILSKADITVTQNGDRFDFITLNERVKALRLSVMNQKASLDILKLSRNSFKAASHKLDFRSEQQGLGGKINMVDQDWVDVEENGVPAEKKMIPYGCKDTADTEKLKWLELPYYKSIPSAVEKVILSFLQKPAEPVKQKYIPKYKGKPSCKVCAAKRQSRFDVTVIKKNKHQCNRCKTIF